MRTFLVAALNCCIRNEPRVPATAQIASASVSPSSDIAFVLIWYAKGDPIQFDPSRLRKVKNVFVAIVEKSFGIDRLKVAECFGVSFNPHLALRVRAGIATGRSAERIEVRIARRGSFLDTVDR